MTEELTLEQFAAYSGVTDEGTKDVKLFWGDIEIAQAPSGQWFVSRCGWGRRFGRMEAALEHAVDLRAGRA